MKKGLLLLGMLMMVSIVEAKTSTSQPNSKSDYFHHHTNPISFIERGVEFFIYSNGELDFNIHRNTYGTTTEYYYRGASRNNSRSHNRRRTRVVRDYSGRIIRVGGVFINYNYRGNVTRVGTVFISYFRGELSRVGGLQIIKNRHGVRYIGSVKRHRHYHTGYYNDYFYDDYVYEYEDDFFEDDDFFDDYEPFNEDENFYYYRSKSKTSKKVKGKRTRKQKMIKRKKRSSLKQKSTKSKNRRK